MALADQDRHGYAIIQDVEERTGGALVIAGVFTALVGIGFGLAPAAMVGGRTALRALRVSPMVATRAE